MNPKLSLIFGRRSVRKYTGKEIGENLLRDLLEAAMAAPSACCKDPWHFVVVRDKGKLKELSDGLPNGKMLAEAAAGLVVCGSLSEAHDRQLSFMLQDCSAAIQNILVAAQALGLGSCWLGVHPREERIAHVRRALGIPADITPLAVIALGWPAEKKEARTRYSEAKVHWERW
ncbi:MAG: nitroreductase family protein [Kiritimatiellae bacterium]|nr:nitroreductase family protein [Kiritimatiellia bacterium]